jgi:hypothetical protein
VLRDNNTTNAAALRVLGQFCFGKKIARESCTKEEEGEPTGKFWELESEGTIGVTLHEPLKLNVKCLPFLYPSDMDGE